MPDRIDYARPPADVTTAPRWLRLLGWLVVAVVGGLFFGVAGLFAWVVMMARWGRGIG
jgi:uncharacterized protein involved in exopolysaccharide biosynthesis